MNRTMLAAVCLLMVLCGADQTASADDPVEFVLVHRTKPLRTTLIAEINKQHIVQQTPDGWEQVPRDACVALFATGIPRRSREAGAIILADGQHLPGQPAATDTQTPGLFYWRHDMLGTLAVRIDDIASVVFSPGPTAPKTDEADVIALTNGDRIEGFIADIGDPIVIEIESPEGEAQPIEIPLDRAVAVSLITPRTNEVEGVRLFLADDTIIDVGAVRLGDDGTLRIDHPEHISSIPPLPLREVRGILFDDDGFVPLARLEPSVSGPETRYAVNPPSVKREHAPLGLADVYVRGPITVRYARPEDCNRFVADVVLPRGAEAYGDYELVIYDDDHEIHRDRLNAEHISSAIDVELTGSELTIEITEGANGPVQDHAILTRAMFLGR